MSAAAVICDAGALLDYLVATAPDHRPFREAIDAGSTITMRELLFCPLWACVAWFESLANSRPPARPFSNATSIDGPSGCNPRPSGATAADGELKNERC